MNDSGYTGRKVKKVSPTGFCENGYEISDIIRARNLFTTGKTMACSRNERHYGLGYSTAAIKLICFYQKITEV